MRIFKTLTNRPDLRLRVRQWGFSTFTLGAVALLQLGGFLLLGRLLGATDYAVIVAVASIVAILAEFVGVGAGDALIRGVSQDKESFPRFLGQAFILIAGTILPVTTLGACLAFLFYDIGVPAYITVALIFSELISLRCLALSEHIAIAHRDIAWANLYRIVPQLFRVSFIAIAFLVGLRSIEAWWQVQFFFGIIFPPLCVSHAVYRYGRPRFSLEGIKVKDNLLFAAGQELRAMQFNIDRFFVGGVGTQAMLGQYGVAARLMQYAMLPIVSVLRITYPMFFKHGRNGLPSSYDFGLKVLFPIFGVSVFISVFLFFAAPEIARLLGPDYAGLTTYLRILAIVPMFIAIQYVFADMLTGADLQRIRTVVLSTGVIALALGSWLGGKFLGPYGIAVAVAAINGLIASVFILTVLVRNKQSSRGASR